MIAVENFDNSGLAINPLPDQFTIRKECLGYFIASSYKDVCRLEAANLCTFYYVNVYVDVRGFQLGELCTLYYVNVYVDVRGFDAKMQNEI